MYQDELSIIQMVVEYMCMYVVCSLSFTQIQAHYKEFQRLQENILPVIHDIMQGTCNL